MLQRLHLWAVVTALAGIAALAAMALQYSFNLVFACICLATAAGFLLVATLQKQRLMLEQAGHALGQFMRGSWGARLQPDRRDDEFSRLQHRLNNMLDAIDLYLRADAAAIDLTTHADYAEKLRFTALYETLSQHKSFEDIKADRTPNESVGVLLQQLGHNVAELFKPEDHPGAPSDDTRHALLEGLEQQLRGLTQAVGRVQAATARLAERAMQAPPTPDTPRPTPSALDQLMARIAEQATVISLNVAIESGRAAAGSALADAADELHGIAVHLHKARADMAALLASVLPPERAVPSVPLSYAIEALANAETALQGQLEAAEELQRTLQPPQPEPMEEAA